MSAFPATLPSVDLLINSTTEFGQEFFSGSQKSTVTALADGRFLVTFIDIGDLSDPNFLNIRVRIFNADGTAAGPDFVANTTLAGGQDFPAATALSDGGFILTWRDQNNLPGIDPLGGIRGQRFDADGAAVGAEFIIPDVRTDIQTLPSVEVLSNGNLVYVWQHNGAGTDDDSIGIRARIVTLTGSVIKADFQVNNFTDDSQNGPQVVALRDGGFMVAFADRSINSGPGDSEISVRFFQNDGTPVASQFRVNTTTAGQQVRAQAAQLENGNIVVTWLDTTTFDLVGRIITTNGTPVTDEFAINTTTFGSQLGVKVTALQDGHFMAVWGDDGVGDGSDGAVRGQIFSATGQKVGGEVILNSITTGTQNNPSVATLSDGRVMVVWMDQSNTAPDTSVTAIRGKIIDTRTAAVDLTGTALDDDWFGTRFNDTMAGGAGNDTLRGDGGNDLLDGGSGADSLLGGAGDDTFIVDNAGDRVIETANSGVDRVLAALSWTLGADLETLTLTGSGNLNGTGNGLDNRISGNAGQNRLSGGGGQDTLTGGGGADTLVGGAGNDDLRGGGGADLLRGQAGNDRLSGRVGADRLEGGGGRDRLDGGGGNDRLKGNAGRDDLNGGAGRDRLDGGGGRDRLDGGGGNDVLIGGALGDTMTGGAGRDTFLFQSRAETGSGAARDVITDFRSGIDRIDLSGVLNGGEFIGNAAFSGEAGQLRYRPGDATLYGDINGDGRADFQIRLANAPAISEADFIF
ncbi:calcium-binding protein [Aliigemmobacter aestuarii]|uniref:Calcium-binding protein n=1 Tax=Aliigemmobacter aestuarii TaxID=1445661 RepID=A0A4S3MLW5_9RHOB|nr:calcium-binding protein [Gemmobacter aestuarii]THD82251.1 calcium-binding protein [Gemmobacter aestuarii]